LKGLKEVLCALEERLALPNPLVFSMVIRPLF
jgi:hypothetical protein